MTDWLTDSLGCGKWTLKVSILPQLCETIKSFIGRHWLSVTLFMAQISPVIKKREDFLSCSALKINGKLFTVSTIHAIPASCTCIPPIKTTSWTDRNRKRGSVCETLTHWLGVPDTQVNRLTLLCCWASKWMLMSCWKPWKVRQLTIVPHD